MPQSRKKGPRCLLDFDTSEKIRGFDTQNNNRRFRYLRIMVGGFDTPEVFDASV